VISLKHIVLDTDPGVDYSLAFLLAFASSEIEVEAVKTVDGNVDVEKGTRSSRKVLEFLGRSDARVSEILLKVDAPGSTDDLR
jgi:inosine-uridine nucleoside N-ribohydrolase